MEPLGMSLSGVLGCLGILFLCGFLLSIAYAFIKLVNGDVKVFLLVLMVAVVAIFCCGFLSLIFLNLFYHGVLF